MAPGDYSGNGTTIPAVFCDRSSLWKIWGDANTYYFGGPWDRAIVADYNGDGSTDIAIFRPENSLWAARGVTRCYFGEENDFRAVK